jgi:hypothetical protein
MTIERLESLISQLSVGIDPVEHPFQYKQAQKRIEFCRTAIAMLQASKAMPGLLQKQRDSVVKIIQKLDSGFESWKINQGDASLLTMPSKEVLERYYKATSYYKYQKQLQFLDFVLA